MQKNKDNNIINFPHKKSKLEKEVEAIIFAAEEPLDVETIEERVKSSASSKVSQGGSQQYLMPIFSTPPK